MKSPPKIIDTNLAKIAYDAYAKSTGGKTWDGCDMPAFEALPANIQEAWLQASEASVLHAGVALCKAFVDEFGSELAGLTE